MKRLKKRVTPARTKIFKIVHSAKSPISADKLVKEIGVNKTTIYRDLDLFLKNGFIDDVDFGDGIKRYEVKEESHHHHLVCMQCKNVQDISFEENLKIEEQKIARNNNFKVIKHNLEFFGYCQNCI
ncbi:MAG TPA: Fur family transcriptional regulator [Patescibacteria group bacterium]|nr:Fur family transcriptional regulator [Patescibacteria group bacterium]